MAMKGGRYHDQDRQDTGTTKERKLGSHFEMDSSQKSVTVQEQVQEKVRWWGGLCGQGRSVNAQV